jgi:hypothetical protein
MRPLAGIPQKRPPRGRGVKRVPGQMNGLERRYASYLDGLVQIGDVLGYWFDAVKLRLAEKTFYSPDFMVLTGAFEIEMHEVKGNYWEDDARVKIKVAADKFPFKFFGITWKNGQWNSEGF